MAPNAGRQCALLWRSARPAPSLLPGTPLADLWQLDVRDAALYLIGQLAGGAVSGDAALPLRGSPRTLITAHVIARPDQGGRSRAKPTRWRVYDRTCD
jgi:hypothetical protein